jgi:hypothetical protein
MPLFNKKQAKSTNGNGTATPAYNGYEYPQIPSPTLSQMKSVSPIQPQLPPPQLVFHCQLAHGSPTGLITGFSSVKELYQKIAECYDFPIDEVILKNISNF